MTKVEISHYIVYLTLLCSYIPQKSKFYVTSCNNAMHLINKYILYAKALYSAFIVTSDGAKENYPVVKVVSVAARGL
jgi:hypothetical protein